jgi:hypothetical protein
MHAAVANIGCLKETRRTRGRTEKRGHDVAGTERARACYIRSTGLRTRPQHARLLHDQS